METLEGEWINYEHSDNDEENKVISKKVAQSVKGKGSGWCIAGENLAYDTYLNKNADFHIYYTRNKEGNNTIHRVAIVQEKNRVKKVRGIEWEENVDDYIKGTNIISDKLKELPGGEEFFEIDADTKYLTAIDQKVSAFKTETDTPLKKYTAKTKSLIWNFARPK